MKPSGIQVNKPVLAFLVLVICAVVWYFTSGTSKPETVAVDGDVKKGGSPVLEPPGNMPEGQSSGNVPSVGTGEREGAKVSKVNDEVINLKQVPKVDPIKVKSEELKKIKVKAGSWEGDVEYIKVMPTKKSKQDVLLLHGASFSAKNWGQIKTLGTFAALGYQMVAINHQSVDEKLAVDFLVNVIKALKLNKPVVVSPSASGQLAIPLLVKGQEHIRGFVSLAPVGTENFSRDEYKKVKVPALIVYGEKDKDFGLHSLENLKNIPNHKVFVIKDGNHAAYINKPEEFHLYLYNFLENITAHTK